MKRIKTKTLLLLTVIPMLMLGKADHIQLPALEKGLGAQAQALYNLAKTGQFINNAHAVTVLNQANLVRFMYWIINGPPSGGYPTGMDGPEDGFLGMIRDINGPTALGGGLRSCGYTTCSSIPSSGSCNMVDEGGTFTMSFSAPSQTVPAGYTSGETAGSYDKKVSVNFSDGTNNVDFMIAEFNCSSTSGYMRFTQPNDESTGNAITNQATAHNIEVYYDTSSSSSTKMELYMFKSPTAPSSSDQRERFMVKFATEASSKFKIWITRYAYDGTSEDGFRTAIYGDMSNDLANVMMEFDQTPDANTNTSVATDNDDILTQDIQCIDFNDGGMATDATGSCGALTLTSPGAPILSGAGDFSMEWVKDTMPSLVTSF